MATTGMRKRKRAACRAATLDTAFRLFVERGYDNVTVADVCAASDIAQRTFFRYFTSKEDLLLEPMREMGEQVRAAIAAAPPAMSDAAVLRAALIDLADYALARRQRLADLALVLPSASSARLAPSATVSQQETALAGALLTRRGVETAPDWRTRLLVARSIAVYRVWLDELTSSVAELPRARLKEMFEQMLEHAGALVAAPPGGDATWVIERPDG